MESDSEMFKVISESLIQITSRLQKLSSLKLTFSKDIHYQINAFYQLVNKQLSSTTINIKSSTPIKIKSFAQIFQIDKQYLYLTLFRQNNKPCFRLSPERLCTYLKINIQNLKKTYTTQPISKSKIIQFIHIVKEQIQILAETQRMFSQNHPQIQKIFEEIDFFNNKYIDCASFAEFFNHYASNKSPEHSQIGCMLLINMIKGYESTGEKLFLQDLLEFIQDQQLPLSQENSSHEEVPLKQKNSKQSIDFDCILEKSCFSVSNKNNDSLEYRTSSHQSYRQSSLDQQSVIPHKYTQSIDDEQMAVNLSISQSMSPKSVKNRDFFGLGNSFHKTFQQETVKNQDIFIGHRFTSSSINCFDDFVIEDKKESIKIEHEYKVPSISRTIEDQGENTKQMLEKPKKSVFLEMSEKQRQIKLNQKFTILPSPFKSFFPDQSSRIPSTLRQQKKLVYASSLSNNFESSLIRSHSRNLAYLSQVKLSDKSCPKVIENCESIVTNKTKNVSRTCLTSKFSFFQAKKVQFVFTLQSLVQEYARWYSVIEQLIIKHEKFTLFTAFSVIDVQETNEVTFSQFKEFLKDSGIQKKHQKIQFFFNKFSVFKTQLKIEGDNKENFYVQKQRQIEVNALKVSQFEQKVMRYSDFMKIFYLQKTIPLVKVCKKRAVIVQQKWDQKMKSNYCKLLRIVMDSCFQIENIIKSAKKTYTQMRQINGEETYEKTFGRQIMRFDEMQKILGLNSTTLLNEISRNEPYVDEQKLMRYLKIELSEE